MYRRRIPWGIIAVAVLWWLLRPVEYGLFTYAGAPFWLLQVVQAGGSVAIPIWFMLWLRRSAAPMRLDLASMRSRYPSAFVNLVLLDPEWNPISEQTMGWLVAMPDRLELHYGNHEAPTVLTIVPLAVRAVYVSAFQLGIAFDVDGTVWTLIPFTTTLGRKAGKRVVHDLVERIATTAAVPTS